MREKVIGGITGKQHSFSQVKERVKGKECPLLSLPLWLMLNEDTNSGITADSCNHERQVTKGGRELG